MFKSLRKNCERFWNHYGRSLTCGLTVLTVILSFIGSYQYYHSFADTAPGRLWSSVAYSTLQLYLFSPTVGIGEATPLCYEIAKWLAPLCTAYWILKALESLLWHGMGLIKRALGRRRQIVIFGYNENSQTLIDNIYQDNLENGKASDDVMTVLVTEKALDKSELVKLERRDVIVFQMDFLDDENLMMADDFKRLKLWNADEVVLFYEDATLNFTVFTRLLSLIRDTGGKHWESRKEGSIICAFQCNDNAVKKIVTNYYGSPKVITDDPVMEDVSYNPFNLRIFSLPELAVEKVLSAVPLYENCLPPQRDSQTGIAEYMAQIRNPHLLIAGFGSYGQAFFEKALLMGTFSDSSETEGYEKPRITIVDEQAGHYRDLLYARYPRLDRICTVEFLSLDVCGRALEEQLDLLPAFTYAAVCFGSQTTNILTMLQLARYSFIRAKGFPVPIVTRMETDGAMVRYIRGMTPAREEQIENYGYVIPFGSRNKLLTRQNLIAASMEMKAEHFHQAYERQAARIYDGKPCDPTQIVPWNRLDFERKESNRVLVLNQPYFKELIRRLNVTLPEEADILTKGEGELRFLEELEDGKLLDILARLEHKRWCNFCYAYGYTGSAGKGKRVYRRIEEDGKIYYGRVHDCLVDDWQTMKTDSYLRDTIKFDLCSIYRYLEFQTANQ